LAFVNKPVLLKCDNAIV